MTRWGTWLLAAVCALALAVPARAEPWDEAQYESWVADHLLRVVALLQLPAQFTLDDLRDWTIEQQRVLDEAAVAEPPPRYAAVHRRYREALEDVAQFQAGLQTVVLTRAPVAGLDARQAAAFGALSRFVSDAQAAGVPLDEYLLAVLPPGRPSDTGGDARESPLVAAPAPTPASAPRVDGSPAAAPGSSAPAGRAARASPSAADSCAEQGGCVGGLMLRARLVSRPLVLPASRAAPREHEGAVVVFVGLENIGSQPLTLIPASVTLEGAGGGRVPASYLASVAASRGPNPLVLVPGHPQGVVAWFQLPSGLRQARPWRLRLVDASGGRGALVVRLP
ncbi:MAG: hypothetical protein IRZ14_16660 [Chloroflexi bacterium]|nr:hypothetical protein [Chloroflexota bacterium]